MAWPTFALDFFSPLHVVLASGSWYFDSPRGELKSCALYFRKAVSVSLEFEGTAGFGLLRINASGLSSLILLNFVVIILGFLQLQIQEIYCRRPIP